MPVLNEKFYIGTAGADKSWQASFPGDTECESCGKNTPLTFVGYDENSEKMLVNMKDKDHFKGDGGFHDAVSFACYICPACWHSTMYGNQA